MKTTFIIFTKPPQVNRRRRRSRRKRMEEEEEEEEEEEDILWAIQSIPRQDSPVDRRPFLMQLHQQVKSTHSIKLP